MTDEVGQTRGISCNGGKMRNLLEPGMLVRHPNQPDWGLGQVQSAVGAKVTVNFEHAGKVVIDSEQITLLREFNH
jgi:hypothetical protein